MNNKNKSALSTALVAGLSLGACYVFVRYYRQIGRQLSLLFDYPKNPLRYQRIEIVNNSEDCLKIVNILKLHCSEYRVLGFDCEWVTVNGSRRPVALLQLASHKGLCALIRLCSLKRIPVELKELLENISILKVGVAPSDDAKYLALDYAVNVKSTLDLRYIAKLNGFKPEGLGRMTKSYLNVELDKNWRIRCSDWECQTLNDVQMVYAAKDAHVAIELFKHFLRHKSNSLTGWLKGTKDINTDMDRYNGFLNIKYYDNGGSNQAKSNEKHNSVNRKQQSRTMTTLVKPLYTNCLLQAPDGELLCTIDEKKAKWYIEKELGTVVQEAPYTVRLNFEPSGRAVGTVGQFYKQEKINQCVVCGCDESYLRKNIIPREYRRFFPDVMKNHSSHDVVLLCPGCHQLSNMSDLRIRKELSEQCDAPLNQQNGTSKLNIIPDKKQLKSNANAILTYGHKIPESRLTELRNEILKHFPPGTELTDELLMDAAETVSVELNEDYNVHGERVCEYFRTKHSGGLVALELIWREHFLHTMKPKFLPNLWSVEHTLQRLEIRAVEGRVEQSDLLIAGVRKFTKDDLI